MTIIVNGETRQIPEGATLQDLLRLMGVRQERGVAVARNGDVMLRSAWGNTRLDEDDRVEVLHAVQGG